MIMGDQYDQGLNHGSCGKQSKAGVLNGYGAWPNRHLKVLGSNPSHAERPLCE